MHKFSSYIEKIIAALWNKQKREDKNAIGSARMYGREFMASKIKGN